MQGAWSAAQWQSELQAFCRQQGLSRFKVPGVICCQTAPLPVNNSGKIVKHEVKALLSDALRRHGAVSRL
jgi:acyl-coenzyme A synthetase/AMP-(fatty) acid ligase